MQLNGGRELVNEQKAQVHHIFILTRIPSLTLWPVFAMTVFY